MKSFVLWLIIVASNSLFSQGYIEYHNLCNEGAELIELGQFSEAKIKLTKALKLVNEPLAIDYFNLAKCYSQLNEKDSTIKYLKLSLKLDSRTKKICSIHYLWFEPILGKSEWTKIQDSNYYIIPESSIKQNELLKLLDSLFFLDQEYVQIQTDSISVYYPNDTVLYKKYDDSIRFNQVLIQNSLDSIISRFGWPSKKITGRNTPDGLLLIHTTDDWFKNNNDRLIKEIDLGNLLPWDYANIADRKRHENNQSILYNGYFFGNNEITSEIRKNCNRIGMPLGKTLNIRAFYSMNDYY